MSNSAEWASFAGSPGLSPLGPNTVPVRFSKWLGGVSEVLGTVLEILGVIKKFAVLLEDPLTAIIVDLESKIKAYLQDKGGFYLSYDLNRLIKAYENRPKPVYRGNPTIAEKANLELQSFYTFLGQFQGISSFNREYYNRLTNTNITPRPIAYNSTVFALFLAFGANVDTIKPLISLLIFIDQFFNGRSMQPSIDGFRYGFTLKPNPLDMFDLNNTVVSYQDVVKGSREVQQLSVTVDLNSLTAIFENSQLVFYTNPEGFVRFRSTAEKDGKSETEESRIIYHFADSTDTDHLVYAENKELKKTLPGVDTLDLKNSYTDKYTLLDTDIKSPAQLVVDFNDFITVNEVLIANEIFKKLKYPVIDETGLKLIANPDPGTLYARVYFTKSKTYSAPLKIKLPQPIDFDGCIQNIIFCLLYYRQKVLKNATPDNNLKSKLNGRIPEDIFTTIESYCGYLEFLDDKLGYDAIKKDNNFLSLSLNLADYPYLSRVFNFSTLDVKAKIALDEKLKQISMTDHTLKYDPEIDITSEVVTFLDSILIAKYPVPDSQADSNAVWKKGGLYNIDTLKELMNRFFRFLKEFAESLKGAGQGLIKAISNLEKWVKFLKSLVDIVNMIIQLIIKFVDSLSGDFSVNLLYYPNANGEAASSVQDLANKLLSSTIPTSESNPNPESQYYLGAALVWPTGVPNFLMDILSSLITSWGQSGDTGGESGEEEVEL